MKKKFSLVAMIVVVFFAVILIVLYFLNPFSETLSTEMAPVQRNLKWQREEKSVRENPPVLSKGIFVRSEENKAENLLIKFDYPTEFYRYDGISKAITPVTEQEWLSGKREISCRERDYIPRKIVQIDTGEATMYVWEGGQKIPTFGKFALDVQESLKSNLAIVLSSDGYRARNQPGFIFGGKGGEIYGNRFVQILELNSKTYITEPLQLFAINKLPNYGFCWTDDEKYVLAYELEYIGTGQIETSFHIIKTNK